MVSVLRLKEDDTRLSLWENWHGVSRDWEGLFALSAPLRGHLFQRERQVWAENPDTIGVRVRLHIITCFQQTHEGLVGLFVGKQGGEAFVGGQSLQA